MIFHPLVWIVVSMAAYALITNLAWAAALEPSRFGLATAASRKLGLDGRAIELALVGRVLYFFGVPLLAIALRVGRPSHWGLAWPPSAESLVLAAIVSVCAAVVLAAGSLWLDRSANRHPPAGPFVPPSDTVALTILLALMREAHWAFFRTGPLAIGLDNTTLAVFLALGLLTFEGWSNPRTRAAFDDVRACRQLALGAGLAVLSALVFLLTGSTPVCVAAHILVALALLVTVGYEHGRRLSLRRGPPTAVDRRRGSLE